MFNNGLLSDVHCSIKPRCTRKAFCFCSPCFSVSRNWAISSARIVVVVVVAVTVVLIVVLVVVVALAAVFESVVVVIVVASAFFVASGHPWL